MTNRWQIDVRANSSAPYKEADRIWFKVLPERRYRCRRLYETEPRPTNTCTYVVVRQIRLGFREKCYLGHPSMTERLDAVESEAMCKYLWDLLESAPSYPKENNDGSDAGCGFDGSALQ